MFVVKPRSLKDALLGYARALLSNSILG